MHVFTIFLLVDEFRIFRWSEFEKEVGNLVIV